jgi:hypothetical protein
MVVGSSSPNPPSSIPIEVSAALNRLEEFDSKRRYLVSFKGLRFWVESYVFPIVLGFLFFGLGAVYAESDEGQFISFVLFVFCFIISMFLGQFRVKKRLELGFFENLNLDDAAIDLDFVNRYSVQTENYSLQGRLLEYHKGIASYAKRLRNAQAAAVLGTIIIGAAAASALRENKK